MGYLPSKSNTPARSSPLSSDGERPSLEAVLDHYGVDYKDKTSQMIRCPLHEDNTPSLSVNLTKEVFNCHSCGEGGDSYKLIMLMEGVDFAGAREFATTQQFATGVGGGSGSQVRSSAYGGGRTISAGKRTKPGGNKYKPSWRSS